MKRTRHVFALLMSIIRRFLLFHRKTVKSLFKTNSEHGGADAVLEVAGAESTFKLAWECARPNAIVTVVALYDKAQMLTTPRYVWQESYF